MSSPIRLWAVVLCFIALSASAATFVVYDDHELVRRADAIVIANVMTSYPQIASYGAVETVTSMSVEQVIKGSINGPSLDVHEPGGRLGNMIRVIPGSPRFRDGERVLLFLIRTPQGTWSVMDMALGRFTFETDIDGQQLAIREETEIAGWDLDMHPHKEIRRSAAKFLAFIKSEVAGRRSTAEVAVAYRPLRAQSDSSRQLVTSAASTSPTSYLTDTEFGTGTGRGSRWQDFTTPKLFYTESGTAARGINAMRAGMAPWNNDCQSNVNYIDAGTDPGTHTNGLAGAPDGFNTVLFERNMAALGLTGYTCGVGGTAGQGGISANGSAYTGPAGEQFFDITEVDVEIAAGVLACNSLSDGDLASVLAHELGHTLGFRHSDQNRAGGACVPSATFECSSGAIMTSQVPNGLSAVLQAWDLNAVHTVYPSAGTCAPTKRFDSNLDGKADVVFRNTASGADSIWFMNGTTILVTGTLPTVDPAFSVVAIADFQGDGRADIVWRNTATGANVMWLMNGGAIASSALLPSVADPNWKIVGAGDLDGDRKADLIWRNSATGDNAVWFMNGTAVASTASLPSVSDTTWKIAAIGDFQNDGKVDFLWRNSVSGADSVWLMNGASIAVSAGLPTVPDLNWQIVGVGDIQGDGNEDVVWRNSATGDDAIWFMSGTTMALTATIPSVPDPTWKIVRVGDFQGDGKADIFWRNSSSGADAVWLMNGPNLAVSAGLPTVSDTNFQVVP